MVVWFLKVLIFRLVYFLILKLIFYYISLRVFKDVVGGFFVVIGFIV